MIRFEVKSYNTILTEEHKKYQYYHQIMLINMNHEYLVGKEILSSDQSRTIEQAKFTNSSLGKAFEKQI